MKTLLLLRGIPGAGKSTFIKEHHLEPYTLSSDAFRLIFSAPKMSNDGGFEIDQTTNKDAWELLYNGLEKRMQRGDFTIIDATNCNPRYTTKYIDLAEKYRYSTFYLDFDISFEEAIKRNNSRPAYQKVPERVINNMYLDHKRTQLQSCFKKINNIDDILNYYTANLDKDYDHVRVIGDVHSCYTVLHDSTTKNLDPRTKYIFVGDLFERGLENVEMFNWLSKHYTDRNIIFVCGNHDEKFYQWAIDNLEPSGGLRVTINDILGNNPTDKEVKSFKSEIRQIYRKFVQCYAFEFDGQKYFVSHGGVPSLPKMTLIPTDQLIHGVGRYGYNIDDAYEKNYLSDFWHNPCQNYIQIHGHRFPFNKGIERPEDFKGYNGTDHSYCLEGDIEDGGYLKVLFIEKETEDNSAKRYVVNYRNFVYDKNRNRDTVIDKDVINNFQTRNFTTNRIIHSDNIKVKDQHDHNLMSINFTPKVFYSKSWDDCTIRARGLFVDKTSGEIKLRSYNKFFNIDEVYETKKENLAKHLVFPLKVYEKENGFLGIMSVVDGDIVLASKTSTSGPHVGYFREVFDKLQDDEVESMKEVCESNNCSIVFEVLSWQDKHIIDFNKDHLWLLDVIPNSYDFSGTNINEEFSEAMKDKIKYTSGICTRKKLLLEANSLDEVLTYADSRKYDRDIEGVVCQDRNGFMFKLKFNYYITVKHLRTAYQEMMNNWDTNHVNNPNEDPVDTISFLLGGKYKYDEKLFDFLTYFAFHTNLKYEELKKLHIIDAVKMYEENTGRYVVPVVKKF